MEAAIKARQQPHPASPAQPILCKGPTLGKKGKFLLLKEIQKERSLRPGHTPHIRGRSIISQGLQAQESEAHGMAARASNRQWKPD